MTVLIHAEIANHAGEIAELFKPGAKVTILIRNPSLDDGDMVVTDDLIDSAIAALGRLKEKEEQKLSREDVLVPRYIGLNRNEKTDDSPITPAHGATSRAATRHALRR